MIFVLIGTQNKTLILTSKNFKYCFEKITNNFAILMMMASKITIWNCFQNCVVEQIGISCCTLKTELIIVPKQQKGLNAKYSFAIPVMQLMGRSTVYLNGNKMWLKGLWDIYIADCQSAPIAIEKRAAENVCLRNNIFANTFKIFVTGLVNI